MLGGTAFIPVGQFDVYRSLEQFGMHFDYGELDLTFDNDSGNLSRIESIVKLVNNLTKYTADELYDMTKESTEHNQQLVTTGEFFHNCQINNLQTNSLHTIQFIADPSNLFMLIVMLVDICFFAASARLTGLQMNQQTVNS